jgi:trans-aconitate methyltransferase
MSGFSAAWLAVREPADAAARSAAVVDFVGRPFQGRLLDLGGGTGANVRYLSPKLQGPQVWTIVDNDASLLERAPAHATRRHLDLNTAVEDTQLFDGCSLVTASALLDLVSERWLEKLVERCRETGAAVLFALTYDGRIACSPEEPGRRRGQAFGECASEARQRL